MKKGLFSFPYWRSRPWTGMAVLVIVAGLVTVAGVEASRSSSSPWDSEWPKTDFSKRGIEFSEILSGGPPKDGIPSIDTPQFKPISEGTTLGPDEPVIAFSHNGDHRAYPLRVLMWHEIVNDTVGGMPVVITYCPLCNSSIVFERTVAGDVLDFGTTGKLRNSDLVMYDRQSESWWQQFSGKGIVGKHTGTLLEMLPSRMESISRFAKRAPGGKVLVPANPRGRRYGTNPYAGYDQRSGPYPFFQGDMPDGIEPMVRVVVVDDEAWALPLLRQRGSIRKGDLKLSWVAGQNTALGASTISKGRDVGNVTVKRGRGKDAADVVHHITFAFVFHAFSPKGKIHTK